jgi:hypothetical protein
MNEWALGNPEHMGKCRSYCLCRRFGWKRIRRYFFARLAIVDDRSYCDTITRNEIARQTLYSLSFLARVFYAGKNMRRRSSQNETIMGGEPRSGTHGDRDLLQYHNTT